MVTSRHGARRVGRSGSGGAEDAVGVRRDAHDRELGELAGRPVDVVPVRQTGAELVAAMPPVRVDRLLLVQAELADADRRRWPRQPADTTVTAVMGYRTESRRPTRLEREAMGDADAVTFASGSRPPVWVEAVGTSTPARSWWRSDRQPPRRRVDLGFR